MQRPYMVRLYTGTHPQFFPIYLNIATGPNFSDVGTLHARPLQYDKLQFL